MKITAELYGNKIGVSGNLVDLITKKECQVLLTFKSNDDRTQQQFVLNADDVDTLIGKLQNCINDPLAKANGFKLV
jgi:hypothetical protein